MGNDVEARKARVLKRLSGDDKGCIEVDPSFSCAEGQALADNVVIGKLLGCGLQGEVYRLEFSDGEPTGWVLKAARRRVLAMFMPSIAREWAIGRQLVLALSSDRDCKERTTALEPLRGFLRTGAAVVSSAPARSFKGEILEMMSGQGLDSVLTHERSRINIAYIRRMLSEVFHALVAAQSALAFRHWDLRLANVMEHEPDLKNYARAANVPIESLARSFSSPETNGHAQMEKGELCFKIIDFGHSKMRGSGHLLGPKGETLPRIPCTERLYRLFWTHRHDVYRILMSLQNVIDGWTWASEDRAAVLQLQELIQHVTGVHLIALFGTDKASSRHSGCLRRSYIRITSFWHFRNGRMSAREALQMPFFTDMDAGT